MKNRWSDSELSKIEKRYAQDKTNLDIARRVYTSRLLGSDENLVRHGGGNTSVKTVLPGVLGGQTEVLCIKGSGFDLGSIDPTGFPAVKLGPLQKLIPLEVLTDEEMLNFLRTNLVDAASSNPSVETLLHAFLPHKFVDHTHANAILTLTDQVGGEELCREVFGERLGFVPYIMPGFGLAKKAKEIYDAAPEVEGLILFRHGIVSFGDTAREAYDRMIEITTHAEEAIAARKQHVIPTAEISRVTATASEIAPIIRGLCAVNEENSWVLEFRTNDKILNFVNGKELERYSQQGTITPDHVIRTKPTPLIMQPPMGGDLSAFRRDAERGIKNFSTNYTSYFQKNNKRRNDSKVALDSMPRIILVPGLGLFALGETKGAATIAGDLAVTNIDVITDIEQMGTYEGIREEDIFDVEYWSLEQAKLGIPPKQALHRKIVIITGGGSGIGAAIAKLFSEEGANVAVLDLVKENAEAIAGQVGGIGLCCDVTDPNAVRTAFDAVAQEFGGLDILVSNAGAAWQGKIGEIDFPTLRKSFELNFFAHQSVAQAAVSIFLAQGIGGCLLFNTSKQAVNPGKNFGPYGLPKAATLSLMKQYALDYGEYGIRSNAVNADRIRSGLLTEDMIVSRSRARSLSEEDYMAGNLLGREVTARDVAKAFLNLALAQKTTAATLTVDGGNIEASLR